MDTLSDILRTINLTSAVYFRRDFPSPWGMSVDSGSFAQFHMIVRGHCWLQTASSTEPVEISSGDLLIFPFGDAHSLYDKPSAKLVSGREVVEAIKNNRQVFEGDKFSTTLVCGHFEFDRNIDHPLLKALPDVIHIRGSERRELSWLETVTDVIIQEADSDKPGSDVVSTRLAEVLFIQILRTYMARDNLSNSFIAALRDSQISKALKLIHSRAEENWTIDKLGREVGMSRSSFANRFKELVGLAPIEYTTNWRMQKAYEMLKNSGLPLSVISKRVGYVSEPAFNRAFKRRFMESPGAMRKRFMFSRLEEL